MHRPAVNGHIESHYSVKTGQWSPLKFVTDPFLRIHGMAPALNYGQQAYEGLKAFRTPSGDIQIFRPDRNALRLQHSAEFISVPPVPETLFVDAVKAAVSLNAGYVPPHETGAAMYIRPQVYGSSAQLGLSPPEEYLFCVYVLPTGVYHGTHPVNALILDDFDRAAPNGTGSAKVGGNYAPVLRWSEKARNEGYGITLHLDSATHSEVDEFSTSGFIGAIQNGEDITLVVPDSKAVIDSVTSDSIQEIGRSFGWKVEKRSVSGSDKPRHLPNGRLTPPPRLNTASCLSSPRSWLPAQPRPWSPSAPSHAAWRRRRPAPSRLRPKTTSGCRAMLDPRRSRTSTRTKRMPGPSA